MPAPSNSWACTVKLLHMKEAGGADAGENFLMEKPTIFQVGDQPEGQEGLADGNTCWIIGLTFKSPSLKFSQHDRTVQDEGTYNLCANLLIDLPKQALIIPSFNCYSELHET